MHPAPYVRKCSFMKTASKNRKKNFTSSEIEVLLLEIHKVIFRSISSGIKGPAKAKEWEKIMSAVNSLSPEGHTVTEIKTK